MKRILATILCLALLAPAPVFAGGSCSIFRSWNTGESLTASDLTSSFTTVGVTNMTPQCLDDYSTNNTEMRTNTDPYPASVESRPTTLAGELERVRYVIKNTFGWTQWYTHAENINIGSRSLKLGTNPSSSGVIRIPNNTFIAGRNAANTSDIQMITVDTDNVVALGGGSAHVAAAVYRTVGQPATAGELRLGNAQTMQWRNFTNTGNITGISVNTSNEVELGGQSATVIAAAYAAGATTAATAGEIRLGNNSTIRWRNAANTANLTTLQVSAANITILGASNGSAIRIGGDTTATLAFFGGTPAARAAAYTVTNGLTDRSYDADATSTAELADVLATLIADLKTYGLLQ